MNLRSQAYEACELTGLLHPATLCTTLHQTRQAPSVDRNLEGRDGERLSEPTDTVAVLLWRQSDHAIEQPEVFVPRLGDLLAAKLDRRSSERPEVVEAIAGFDEVRSPVGTDVEAIEVALLRILRQHFDDPADVRAEHVLDHLGT